MASLTAGYCHDLFPHHAPAGASRLSPAQPGSDPYAYLPKVPSFQLPGNAGVPQYVGAAPTAGSGVPEYCLTVTALSVGKSRR
jgi:hypothetical protein